MARVPASHRPCLAASQQAHTRRKHCTLATGQPNTTTAGPWPRIVPRRRPGQAGSGPACEWLTRRHRHNAVAPGRGIAAHLLVARTHHTLLPGAGAQQGRSLDVAACERRQPDRPRGCRPPRLAQPGRTHHSHGARAKGCFSCTPFPAPAPATVTYWTSEWKAPGAASFTHVRMPRVCGRARHGA